MSDSSTTQDVQEIFRRKVFQDPTVFLNTANVQPTARIIAHVNGYFNGSQVRKETSNGGQELTNISGPLSKAESCTDDTDDEQPVHHGFETWLGSEEINDSTNEEESLEIPDGGQELSNGSGHLSQAESCNSLPGNSNESRTQDQTWSLVEENSSSSYDSEGEENNSISNDDRDLESPNGAEALDRLASSSEDTDDDQPVRDRPIPAVERHLGRLRMRKSSASS